MTKHSEARGVGAAGRRYGSARIAAMCAAGVCAVVTLACRDEPPAAPVLPPEPATGSIIAATTVTGEDIDMDGFDIRVDDGSPRTVTQGSAVVFAGLAPGPHTVSVDHVASNCALSDANPRTVTVVANEATGVLIRANCQARVTPGSIRVLVVTPGFSSFGAAVGAGGIVQAVAGTVVFTNLAPGIHSVALHISAGVCTIDGPNPRQVSVTGGRTTDVPFSLTCPQTGSIRVQVVTPGFPAFGAGLGAGAVVHAVGGTVHFTNLAPGVYSVTLIIDPGACTVDGLNPRQASVKVGQTTDVPFSLTCPVQTGSLEINVTTTGTNQPSGYMVRIGEAGDHYCYSGACQDGQVSANGAVRFDGLPAVAHYVSLYLPGNCTASPVFYESVVVEANRIAHAPFAVTCN
ncbi:MAG: hypothetical protein L0271_01400 [Gemmatimonadetes bacterium]|nr:hypothetical protein [Gemmatimonadota bacterium]